MKYINRVLKYIVLVSSFLLSTQLLAKVLFEGYYKVLAGDKHAGFFVQRYSYDETKKQFLSIYYLQTNKIAGDIKESLKAYSSDKYAPLSYDYTLIMPGKTKTISAQFKDYNMKAIITEGNSKSVFNNKIKKGTFLSTFLPYLMLSNGFEKGKSFKYFAIAEETAKIVEGSAAIMSTEKFNKTHDVFKIKNTFDNTSYLNWVTPIGTTIKTDSPSQGVSTQLTTTSEEATSGFQVDEKVLKYLFGAIPKGKNHEFVDKSKQKSDKKSQ